MRGNEMKLLAKGTQNSSWDYYLKTYEDGSEAVMYIAKENSGCDSGIYCGTENLRSHFHRLRQITGRTHEDSLIPIDWIVIDREFFEALAIK